MRSLLENKRLILILAALWIGLALAERRSERHHVSKEALSNLVYYSLFGYILGGRLLYALANYPAFAQSPLSLFSLNLDLFDPIAAFVVSLMVGLVYGARQRLSLWPTLDSLTPLFATLWMGFSLAHLAAGGRDLLHLLVGAPGGRERRRRIALHHDRVGAGRGEQLGEALEHAAGESGEGLVRTHDVEVDVGRQREDPEDLVQHLAMLARRDDERLELVGGAPQRVHDGGELYCFRSRSEDERDSVPGHVETPRRRAGPRDPPPPVHDADLLRIEDARGYSAAQIINAGAVRDSVAMTVFSFEY